MPGSPVLVALLVAAGAGVPLSLASVPWLAADLAVWDMAKVQKSLPRKERKDEGEKGTEMSSSSQGKGVGGEQVQWGDEGWALGGDRENQMWVSWPISWVWCQTSHSPSGPPSDSQGDERRGSLGSLARVFSPPAWLPHKKPNLSRIHPRIPKLTLEAVGPISLGALLQPVG